MHATRPAPRPRGPLRLGAALLALLVAAGLLAAPAFAAKGADHARIDVISPSYEGRVTTKTLVVKMKVSTTAVFYATVAGHDVSKRFHHEGGYYVATLRRGQDFRVGENALVIGTGLGKARRVTTVPFTALRHAKGFLTVSELPAVGYKPLRFRLRTTAPVSGLRVTINGHRYPLTDVVGRRVWTLPIGAGDGLRYGRNALVAAAERSGNERYDSESINFHVGRGTPLAGAGPNLRTRSGRAVVLNGGDTKAGTRKGSLLYRWKIVRQPRGSRARIVDPTARTARLLPDLPGSYRVRLVAARVDAKGLRQAKAMEKTATASDAISPEPVCLPNTKQAEGGSVEGFVSLEPVPVCVVPTGEETPPLPIEGVESVSSDETEINAMPTGPIGWPIETITTNHTIQVGPSTYPATTSASYPVGSSADFAHYVVLGDKSLKMESEGFVPLSDPGELTTAVEKTGPGNIVIVTGMGVAQSSAPAAAIEAVESSLDLLNAKLPEAKAEQEAMIKSGDWSAVGSHDELGGTYTNLTGTTEKTPVEGTVGSLAGSVNGHLEPVNTSEYSFVSTEFVPIDTRAPGSDGTTDVIQVGSENLYSAPIPSGALGLHIAVFDDGAAGGVLDNVANKTYALTNPGGGADEAEVKEAALELDNWRSWPGNALIVMQTFGEESVPKGTAPWSAPFWVNDALIPNSKQGLFEWNGQPYLKLKEDSELRAALDKLWNNQYPTVAGQVGDLTGTVGHDLVANFGLTNANVKNGAPTVEVSKLSMVASNHARNPESNYIASAGETFNTVKGRKPKNKKEKQKVTVEVHQAPEGRLAGTLVRNAEGGLSVQNGVPAGTFSPSGIYEVAYSAPEAWPFSGEGPGKPEEEAKAAMKAIVKEVLGRKSTLASLREKYPQENAVYWTNRKSELESLRFHSELANGYGEAAYENLRKQLVRETGEVSDVKDAIEGWENIFVGTGATSALVQTNTITSKILEEVIGDAKNQEKEEAEIDPGEIIGEALYTAADVVGFPEATEELKLTETLGLIAGGIGLAEASTPETAEAKEEPDTEMIRNKAALIGGNLQSYLSNIDVGLGQLQRILVSNWGRLSKAGAEAKESWGIGSDGEVLQRALSVNIAQQLYEGLLPSAYEQWVLAPYQTEWNGAGPQLPPYEYDCHYYTGGGSDSEAFTYHNIHPFKDEPDGGMSATNYRPREAPGSQTPPAQPFTVPYAMRALKSTADKMQMTRETISEQGTEIVSVKHDGTSPKEEFINRLFESTLGKESLVEPRRLGLNKTEFYARFGEGPTSWKRTICAQFNP